MCSIGHIIWYSVAYLSEGERHAYLSLHHLSHLMGWWRTLSPLLVLSFYIFMGGRQSSQVMSQRSCLHYLTCRGEKCSTGKMKPSILLQPSKDFKDFITQMEAQFGHLSPKETAIGKLQTLHQWSSSVDEYILQFKAEASQTNLGDTTLVDETGYKLEVEQVLILLHDPSRMHKSEIEAYFKHWLSHQENGDIAFVFSQVLNACDNSLWLAVQLEE